MRCPLSRPVYFAVLTPKQHARYLRDLEERDSVHKHARNLFVHSGEQGLVLLRKVLGLLCHGCSYPTVSGRESITEREIERDVSKYRCK